MDSRTREARKFDDTRRVGDDIVPCKYIDNRLEIFFCH